MKNIPLTSSAGTRKGDMLYRRLGRTGERVSAIGLGGFHIAQQGLSEDESVRLVCTAIDRGITCRDNSWDYNGGRSEVLMGKALKDGYRSKVFLMTKIDGRTRQLAQQQIETSWERLQTDHIDLGQHHEMIASTIPIAYSRKEKRWKLQSTPRKRARSGSSASPVIKVRTSTSTLRPNIQTGLAEIRPVFKSLLHPGRSYRCARVEGAGCESAPARLSYLGLRALLRAFRHGDPP